MSGNLIDKEGEQMLPKIYYYRGDGTLYDDDVLNLETLRNINGMMVRCYMQNGSVLIGYAEPFRAGLQSGLEYGRDQTIYLWTWDNIDEDSHTLIGDDTVKYNQTHVPARIDQILRIEAILYSNPRWGGTLTNRFFIENI